MLKHHELVEFLTDVKVDGKQLPFGLVRDVAIKTRHGVSPEIAGKNMEATHSESAAMAPAIHDCRSNFTFGTSSRKELEGVDQRLVDMAKLALCFSTQDFCVFDGLRTPKEQMLHVKNGTSRTMQSKHLLGLAVDLVPWVNGRPVWDWQRIYHIAVAVDKAATELGIAHIVRWGGAWDRTLADFGGDASAYEAEVKAYASRHPGKDFLDGPHFELLG